MKVYAYYNEIDPKAAEWLRELIKAKVITGGEVDERSIKEVHSKDLKGFSRCHFFAGIGVWDYALQQSWWSDIGKRVWTGSCPCQPFSSAGKKKGFEDPRHLWPAWHHLIEQCRPDIIFGEQVAGRNGLSWFDLVSADLEGVGYAVGAAQLPVCSVGAPHLRQRLWFVAHSDNNASRGNSRKILRAQSEFFWGEKSEADRFSIMRPIQSSPLGESDRFLRYISKRQEREENFKARRVGASYLLAHPFGEGRKRSKYPGRQPLRSGPVNGFWGNAEWIFCKDGKVRPIEPGVSPLVDGFAGRVGLLRGYGNAINAQAAAAFIRAYQKVTE